MDRFLYNRFSDMLPNCYLGKSPANYKKRKAMIAFGLRVNQMTAVIITIGSILAIAGVSVAIWSIISTRKRYYEDYMRRKRRAED